MNKKSGKANERNLNNKLYYHSTPHHDAVHELHHDETLKNPKSLDRYYMEIVFMCLFLGQVTTVTWIFMLVVEKLFPYIHDGYTDNCSRKTEHNFQWILFLKNVWNQHRMSLKKFYKTWKQNIQWHTKMADNIWSVIKQWKVSYKCIIETRTLGDEALVTWLVQALHR